jgi:GNAT superfamily N-acetyltransferase
MTVCCCRGADAEAVVRLFERIAESEGWRPGGELRRHRETSVYFALLDAGETIGGVQLVAPDSGRLPAHSVWPELPEVGPDVAHVAVLALAPQYRGRRDPSLLWSLCLALWRHCVEVGITELWLEATPKMLRAYRLLGFPLRVQGEMREHWGEECYPCHLSVSEVAGTVAGKALSSTAYRSLLTAAVSLKA